jgi:hypothetical protein
MDVLHLLLGCCLCIGLGTDRWDPNRVWMCETHCCEVGVCLHPMSEITRISSMWEYFYCCMALLSLIWPLIKCNYYILAKLCIDPMSIMTRGKWESTERKHVVLLTQPSNGHRNRITLLDCISVIKKTFYSLWQIWLPCNSKSLCLTKLNECVGEVLVYIISIIDGVKYFCIALVIGEKMIVTYRDILFEDILYRFENIVMLYLH